MQQQQGVLKVRAPEKGVRGGWAAGGRRAGEAGEPRSGRELCARERSPDFLRGDEGSSERF